MIGVKPPGGQHSCLLLLIDMCPLKTKGCKAESGVLRCLRVRISTLTEYSELSRDRERASVGCTHKIRQGQGHE